MPHRPKKIKKADKPKADISRADQFGAQHRANMDARSILSRFQNRKSEKK